MIMQQEEALAKKGYVLAGTGLALPGLVTDDMRLLGAGIGFLGSFATVRKHLRV